MCGRLRVGKNFLHVAVIGRCGHVFGLALERNELQKLVKADPEISHAIEDVSTHSLEYKLARMNRTAQQIRAT